MKRNRLLLTLALSLAYALAAHAQTHPNLEKGFAADKMYQFGNIDHVNVFNGNLTLTIPVGGTTPVSDHLSLSLTLVYNTKLWTAISKTTNTGGLEGSAPFYTPERRSNAGFGWTVTLGRLIDPSETDINNDVEHRFLYLSADGSDRLFYDTLHQGEQATTGVKYSRDNTYLRLSDGGSGKILEFPDGTIQEFQSYSDNISNTCSSPPCAAFTRWRLTKMSDRFGNHIDIDYSTFAQWRITDQYNRLTVIHFSTRASDVDAEYLQQISSIDMPAPGGSTASYLFGYDGGTDIQGHPTDKWVKTGACSVPQHPATPVGYRLPLLKSLTLPDGTLYAFTYTGPIADTLDALPSNTFSCTAGGLASVTLPTKAKITYEYDVYDLPTNPCSDDPISESSGIRTRKVQDPFNPGNDQNWLYEHENTVFLNGRVHCPDGDRDAGASEFTNTVTVSTSAEAVAQKTRYYFSVYHARLGPDSAGTTAHDYGLPFSRLHPDASNTRFLSTETLNAAGGTIRSSYLAYTTDPPSQFSDEFNARVTGSRTVFNDDPVVVDGTATTVKYYTDSSFSDYDGVGHYRTTAVTGNLFGSSRTTTTAYNTVDPLVNPGALATGCYEACSNGVTFVKPPFDVSWVLNLYPTSTTTETGAPGTPAVQEACFDKTNGFLYGTRTRGGTSRANSDLLAIFASDSTTAGGMAGAVTSEKYYGGDLSPLTSSLTQALCDTVAGTPGPLGYDIRHSYTFGVRKTSEYFKNGATVRFKFLDQDIDPGTGLTMHSRDTAGVDTAYNYDGSRRVSSVQTGADPVIHYTYTNATTAAGANVTIDQTSAASGTPKASFDYDGLGRLVFQSRSLPAGILGGPTRWTRQKTVYDAMGRKTQVSEWEESASPSHFMVSSGFDMFGRPGTITRPDSSTTTFAYFGVHQIDRTVHISTSSGDTAAKTVEVYDLYGRLHQVKEPNNHTDTTYSYDVGGRLHGVSMTGDGITQARSFIYDDRGFLLSEHHPELGTPEHPELGTTDYGQYDARGHTHKKTTGAANGIFDLRFTYDDSERLTDVFDNGGTRQLKHFDFAATNDGTNKQQGKLAQATRFNHLAAGDITVTESYQYTKPSGRVSSRETQVKNGTTLLEDYQQDFDYDDLGAITTPGYPTCLTLSCVGTITGATFQYRDGSLFSVPGYASKISYTGNMVSQVDHQGGTTDLYRQNTTNGMARPVSIAFQGVGSCIPAAPVITASSPVCAGSTGNTASVPANSSLQYLWSITGGGVIVGSSTLSSITYTAGSSGILTLSVTVTNTCGTSPAGTRNVAVANGPTATLTGATTITPGSNATLHVALTGTSPWTVTWSDMPSQPQTVTGSFDRIVSPQTTTTCSITSLSDSSAAPCNTGPGGAGVTITVQMLPAPTSFAASLDASNSRLVHLTWATVSGATYRLERSACRVGCGWSAIGPSSIANAFYDYLADPTALPSAGLYHVIAMANSVESSPSTYDFATTATLLFAEPIGSNGVTTIKGTHVQELRRAIDELRRAANLTAAWTDYSPPTGFIFANDVLTMRTALSQAVSQLNGTLSFPGEAPAHNSVIFASQFTQLRMGVK